MKQKLNSTLTNFYTSFFPIQRGYKNNYTYEYILGIGGNIGNTKQIFHKLFLALQSNKDYNIIQTAPILKNPPFGYLEQNYFYNSVLYIQTNKAPYEVLRVMQRYEKRFKRKRAFQDAPRTLDIDIVFAKKGNDFITSKDPLLFLPHRGWKDRESVLYPLSFL
jgi:2-amino-4-hydroxy-6-hydroxymethyldihydropteridine diphosphokinase